MDNYLNFRFDDRFLFLSCALPALTATVLLQTELKTIGFMDVLVL